MRGKKFLLFGMGMAVAAFAVVLLTLPYSRSWVFPPESAKATGNKAEHVHAHDAARVQLSKQARGNLGLEVKEAELETYWRKIRIPGAVVDRPGRSDRGVAAPVAGVVTRVLAVPGKKVRPGEELFVLRPISDSFQGSQLELYKATQELRINKKELERLEKVAQQGALAAARILELEYQRERFNVVVEAHRQDLLTRRLTEEQIDGIKQGRFVTEVVIRAAEGWTAQAMPRDSKEKDPAKPSFEYEVQELKVNRGDFVRAGQNLAYLADHRLLYIEGRAFKEEATLLARAAREGWLVEAEFSDPIGEVPAQALQALRRLKIEFLGSTTDASGLTLPFYVPLANPATKTPGDWLFRPGQRVLLKVAVSKLPDVFVLPLDAVVREGPEAFVFLWNGRKGDDWLFDRQAIHVLHEDSDHAVIANDGSITAGAYLAQSGAAALNRILRAHSAGDADHGHDHHGHSHDH